MSAPSTSRSAAYAASLTPEERLQFAEAALALAGHEVTDPEAKDLMKRIACGEITAVEAIQQTTL